jgi:hypothetical protein
MTRVTPTAVRSWVFPKYGKPCKQTSNWPFALLQNDLKQNPR